MYIVRNIGLEGSTIPPSVKFSKKQKQLQIIEVYNFSRNMNLFVCFRQKEDSLWADERLQRVQLCGRVHLSGSLVQKQLQS